MGGLTCAPRVMSSSGIAGAFSNHSAARTDTHAQQPTIRSAAIGVRRTSDRIQIELGLRDAVEVGQVRVRHLDQVELRQPLIPRLILVSETGGADTERRSV